MPIKPHDCKLARIFAANVRARRQALHFSQEELAERAQVHRTYVGMIERCEKNVTIFNIERFAKALKIPAYELLREPERT